MFDPIYDERAKIVERLRELGHNLAGAETISTVLLVLGQIEHSRDALLSNVKRNITQDE